ncbi:hypothetical protein CTI12_AA266500 [Artemisia annua]|uniref:Uncharacterized protein n=1 Tax=Artemisia annua TaxID=35608 RepID=A0A2U1NHH7_ARTAN|nr:hypothetical protein CTI12_AA266500 [Artemisia annua]
MLQKAVQVYSSIYLSQRLGGETYLKPGELQDSLLGDKHLVMGRRCHSGVD